MRQCKVNSADEGSGIPPELRERVFDKFLSRNAGRRLGRSCTQRNRNGSGIARVSSRPWEGAMDRRYGRRQGTKVVVAFQQVIDRPGKETAEDAESKRV